MAVSRILSLNFFRRRIIYLTWISPDARCRDRRSYRRYSDRGATIPGDQLRKFSERLGPAVLLLFCLAPHGVFRAARITSRAVSSYLAFSPLPDLVCSRRSVSGVSKNRRSFFCDTFRRRDFSTATPAFSTRHAAVWCSDFPLAEPRGSPAIACHQQESSTSTQTMEAKTSLLPAIRSRSQAPRRLLRFPSRCCGARARRSPYSLH